MIPVWFALILSVLFAALLFCIFEALQALSRPAQEKVYVPQYSAEDIKASLELCERILAIHEKHRQLEIEHRQLEIEAKKKAEDPKMAEYALKKDRIEGLEEEWPFEDGCPF